MSETDAVDINKWKTIRDILEECELPVLVKRKFWVEDALYQEFIGLNSQGQPVLRDTSKGADSYYPSAFGANSWQVYQEPKEKVKAYNWFFTHKKNGDVKVTSRKFSTIEKAQKAMAKCYIVLGKAEATEKLIDVED